MMKFLNIPIFNLYAVQPKQSRQGFYWLVIFCQKCINFNLQPSRYEKSFRV